MEGYILARGYDENSNRILSKNHNSLADSIGAILYELQRMLKKYNEYRPHYALNGLTPMMYINKYYEAHQLSQFV